MEWIKLSTSMFGDEKIQLLRADKLGDMLVCVWIQLLCLAGKQDNDGVFMLTETVPYSEAQLAVITGRSTGDMNKALRALEGLGMVTIDNGCVTIINWGKHQGDSVTRDAYKRTNSERQKRYRERQKSVTRNVTHNVTERNTLRYVTPTEKEEEEDKEYILSSNDDRYATTVTDNATQSTAQRILSIWPNLPQSAIEQFVSYASDLPDDVIGYALDETQMKPGAGFKYFKAIMDNLIEKGLTTMAAIRQAEADRKAARAKGTAPEKKRADLNYQQHTYTEADFGDDFFYDCTKAKDGGK